MAWHFLHTCDYWIDYSAKPFYLKFFYYLSCLKWFKWITKFHFTCNNNLVLIPQPQTISFHCLSFVGDWSINQTEANTALGRQVTHSVLFHSWGQYTCSYVPLGALVMNFYASFLFRKSLFRKLLSRMDFV